MSSIFKGEDYFIDLEQSRLCGGNNQDFALIRAAWYTFGLMIQLFQILQKPIPYNLKDMHLNRNLARIRAKESLCYNTLVFECQN